MKVLKVEFTWNVPFGDKGDSKRAFTADKHQLLWLPKRGGVLIDGRFVQLHQAVLTPDGCAACEASEGHAEGCPVAPPVPVEHDPLAAVAGLCSCGCGRRAGEPPSPAPEVTDGVQPAGAAGPARGERGRKKR